MGDKQPITSLGELQVGGGLFLFSVRQYAVGRLPNRYVQEPGPSKESARS